MEYLILTDTSSMNLSAKVNLGISKGWKLQGGVSVTYQSGIVAQFLFTQALVKQEEGEDGKQD